MQVANFVLDAVNTVLDWDMPDEAYPEAVNAQVSLLAGQDGDQGGYDVDVTFH
ncbi:MAG: hypothetical protein K9J76_07325 [Polaromonas sp.]|nr:hypothetical protein [Polaromonas sp.]